MSDRPLVRTSWLLALLVVGVSLIAVLWVTIGGSEVSP